MIDLDIFGRGEIKRLNWELRHEQERHKETQREAQYLRGVTTAQAAAVERLQKEVRAQDELIRQMQETEHKLFAMYNASEAARQSLAEKAGAGGRRADEGIGPYGEQRRADEDAGPYEAAT